jgi:hypothetical protein
LPLDRSAGVPVVPVEAISAAATLDRHASIRAMGSPVVL